MLRTILVDDEKPALGLLNRILKQYDNIEIIGEYIDIFNAIEKISIDSVDVVFLDIDMPKMNGIEAAKKILKINKNIEIIFVTAHNNYAVDAFEFGAVDYIMKPIFPRRLEKAIERIVKKKSITKTIDKLEEESRTDYLTGLYNRRYMVKKIEEIMECQRSFSIIISDIDSFKNINDIYGHNCGDFVIKSVARVIPQTIRDQDFLVRWAGDEFIILLPDTNLESAKAIAETVRKRIENYRIHYKNFEFSITMTFGVVENRGNRGIQETINIADRALYKGKARGRNCVEALAE